jgi:hypothetical protein
MRTNQERPTSRGSTEPSTQALLRYQYLETLQARIQSDIVSLPTRRVPVNETLANACYVDFLHRQRASIGAADTPNSTPDPRLGHSSYHPMRERFDGTRVAANSSVLDCVLALALDHNSNLNGTCEEECSDQAEESCRLGLNEQSASQSEQED